jgi:hypothetical protein
VDAQEFGRRWRKLQMTIPAGIRDDFGFVTYPVEDWALVPLDLESRAILVDVGLPDAAAPYLSFRAGPGMLQAAMEWSGGAEELERFIEIGADGAGNPIAVDKSDASVWLLDHDRAFDRFFVNSTVARLAECLLVFWYWSESSEDTLTAALASVEPLAVEPGSFWHDAVAMMTS